MVFVGKVNKLKRTNSNDRHHGSSSDIWTPLNVLNGGILLTWDSPRFLGNIEEQPRKMYQTTRVSWLPKFPQEHGKQQSGRRGSTKKNTETTRGANKRTEKTKPHEETCTWLVVVNALSVSLPVCLSSLGGRG